MTLLHNPADGPHIRSGRRQTWSFTGFTLIELLVVVAIITILIAILLPSLSNARNSAKKVACMSNQRQLGIAYQCYLEENSGVFPWSYKNPMPSSPAMQGWYNNWVSYIAPYANNDTLNWTSWNAWTLAYQRAPFACPNSYGKTYSYAANVFLTWPVSHKLLQYPTPYLLSVIADHDSTVANPSYSTLTGSTGMGAPHEGKTNILYADYHVETNVIIKLDYVNSLYQQVLN